MTTLHYGTVFLWAPEVPITLQFTDLGPELLKAELRKWINERVVAEFAVNDDPPVSAGGERELIVNFAAVPTWHITNYAPSGDRAICRIEDLEIKAS